MKYHLTLLYREYVVHDRAGLIAKLLAHAGFGLPPELLDPGQADDPIRMFAGYADAPVMIGVSLGPEHRYVFVNQRPRMFSASRATRSSERHCARRIRRISSARGYSLMVIVCGSSSPRCSRYSSHR